MDDDRSLWNYRCRPTRVVDGDTIWLHIDVGFHLTTVQAVRLLGIDTPELNRGTTAQRAAGVAARQAVVMWLAEHPDPQHPDWPYLITTKKTDSFGRWLGVITTPGGDNLNTWLVEQGHAEIYQASITASNLRTVEVDAATVPQLHSLDCRCETCIALKESPPPS